MISMPLPSDFRQKIEDLIFKYQLRREVFTILVPVILAVLLVAVAFLSGFAGLGGGEVAQKTDRQKALELLAQMNADEAGGNASLSNATGTEGSAASGKNVGIDQVIIIAVLIAITPYGIDTTLQKRRVRRKETLFTEFLFKLSELMRGGLNPIKGVVELSKTDLAELTPHVRLSATLMSFGKGFDESMRSMASSLKSSLISRYTDLIIQASYAGGSVADLILKCSEDMRSIIEIEREKEGNLSQYTFIFYFAQGIIVFIAYTLSNTLFPYLMSTGVSSFLGVGSNGLIGLDFRTGFFHLIIINAFFGGLIIGKITEGETKYGLKHSAILIAASYIVCVLFILPVPVTTPVVANATISVIGGDGQTGIPNMPLARPIDFVVRDPAGNPVKGVTVTFSIMPGGNVSPLTETSGDDGVVSVKATLGGKTGSYSIVADAGGGAKALATAKSSEEGAG